MKNKLIFTLIAATLLTPASALWAKSSVKLGYDMGGSHKVTVSGISGALNVNTALNVTYEETSVLNENWLAGMGVEYQAPRAQTGVAGNFSFVPVYGFVQTDLGAANVALKAGYNLFNGDVNYTGVGTILNGGIFYGVSLGVPIADFGSLEISQCINNGSGDAGSIHFDIQYTHTTAYVGINI